MGLSVNILTSGFLVTVLVFFALMGYLFNMSYSKLKQVLEHGDQKTNNREQVESALSSIRIAYILAYIAAGMALLLAVLYAGHETVFSPSEYWHLGLYVITYALMIIAVIYAFMALSKMYDTRIGNRNGADAYIWGGLLMAIFGFIGLTATGSGRIGMNAVRGGVKDRIEQAEQTVNEHLPAIREHAESIRNAVESDLPNIKAKVDQVHSSVVEGAGPQMAAPAMVSGMNQGMNPSLPVSPRSLPGLSSMVRNL